MVSLDDWVSTMVGQYTNVNAAAGNQCWDLSQNWLTFCNGGTLWTGPSDHQGIAAGSWDVATGNTLNTEDLLRHVSVHRGTETGAPGDIIIWAVEPTNYPGSHTAVLIEDRGEVLYCLPQNSSPPHTDLPGYSIYSTGPATRQELTRTGLLGFLRPLATITAQNGTVLGLTELDIDMATPQEVAEAIMSHELTIDGETLRFQDWILRLVRNTRGTLKTDELLTSFDGTKQQAGIVIANAGADARAIKTVTDHIAQGGFK